MVTQATLDFTATTGEIARHGARVEQEAQAERVSVAIGDYVAEFFAARNVGDEFYIRELTEFVTGKARGYVAPGSPDRVMRILRKQRALNYEVVSRSKSLYRITPTDKTSGHHQAG